MKLSTVMFRLALLGSSLFFIDVLAAQVSVNQDSSAPDPSAMLDVKSSDKGMLVPRMTTAQRTAISSPATGLLVFDTDTESFWYRDSGSWVRLISGWNLSGNTGTVDGTNFIGTTDNVALDFRANNARGLRLEYAEGIDPYFGILSPAPNIIGGFSGNTVAATAYGATISGGGISGNINTISAEFATIGGGLNNTAKGYGAVVSGGTDNSASGGSSVGGGFNNTASGGETVVSGGLSNSATSSWSTVGGGTGNMATAKTATVAGGDKNIAGGISSTVPGGNLNSAGGDYSLAAGRRAKIDAAHDGAFLFSDGNNVNFNSAAANEFAARATGGVRFVTAIDGSGNPTQTVRMDNTGTVTAAAFVGDGSGLTGIPDDQTLSLSGATLSIENGNAVNLSGISSDDQTLSLSGATLSIEDGNAVNLSGINTDDQALSLSGATLSIENGNAVNLSSLNTDDQTLSLSGATLSIENGNSVNLSTLPGDNLGNHTATQALVMNDNDIVNGRAIRADSLIVGDGNSNLDGLTLLRFNTLRAWEFQQDKGTNSDAATHLRLRNVSGTPTKRFFIDTDGRVEFRSADGSATHFYFDHSSEKMGIGTAAPANNLSVSGSADFTGNVGIGIASPATRLHVEGAASGSTSTDFVATIKNTDTDATNTTRYNGLKIQAGKDNNNGANSRFIAFYRPDGAEIGTVRQDGASTINYSTSSDVRLKQHIVPTAYSLADLLKIDVQDYEFRTEPGRKQTGFIAQDLYKVYPAAVSKGGEDVVTDPWMVDYGKLTPLLVKSVQDQQATINAQEKRIAELEAQLSQLEILKTQNDQFSADIKAIKAALSLSSNDTFSKDNQ